MQSLFDRLANVALAVKLGVLVGVIALLGGGYYYFVYSEMIDDRNDLVSRAHKLGDELQSYQRRKQEYLAFRNEVNALLEEQKELLQVLPKRDDIEQFIESVQQQIELSGLSKVSSVREAAQPLDMYIKIPVRMSLVGTFHQIDRFFKNVGDLKRIVNIEDLSLAPNDQKDVGLASQNLLKANFVATTFQFVDKNRPGAQVGAKPATSITSGGGK
jgi:type IV pilus assembly protein PilO